MLEEGLGGLVGAAVIGVIRRVGLVVEALDGVPIEHVGQIAVFPGAQLLDLMGGTEAVEEVDEAHAGLDGGQMGDGGQVHDLLGGPGGEHRHAGAAAGHDVLVVAEDGQRVGGQGTRGDMEDAGQALARDLVQVRDHQQQALRGGEGGGEGTGGQGTVDGARGTGLGFHLDDVHLVPKDVLAALGGPLVHMLSHGGGGGDGIDRSDFSVGVCHMTGSRVGVHALERSVILDDHFATPPSCAAMARTWM